MAGAAHADAAHEVEEAVAVDVPDFRAAPPGHDERVVAREGRRNDGAIALEQRPGFGTRQRGNKVTRTHDGFSSSAHRSKTLECERGGRGLRGCAPRARAGS